MTSHLHGKASRCVALLIAAPASGQGKTTVTAALARWHSRQGRVVRVFKCGPDYLDPFWHELASGAPVHNIDGWMVGTPQVQQVLHEAAQTADVILIEGVMGLFDGTPTAADLAQQLGVPVLAVVDARAMAGTFGALVLGMQQYQPGVRWAGVVANRVASARHAELLEHSLKRPGDWLGALAPLQAEPSQEALLPERHLGLVAAHELPDALQRLDQAADAIAQTALGALPWAQWQRQWTVAFSAPPAQPPVGRWLAGRTIAVAQDAAFSFIYSANVQCLQAMGATVVFFSPLAGEALPVCDAVWLPGGYPELFAQQLAAQTALREALRQHLHAGKPIWAECGGMLALAEQVAPAEAGHAGAASQPLWGLVPGTVQMRKKRVGLGMQQCWVQGGWLRGHTFHYSALRTSMQVVGWTCRPHEAQATAGCGEAIYQSGSLHASYFHAWFASHPRAVAALFGAVPVQWEVV